MPKRQLHREVFFAHNGQGPYSCFSCNAPISFYDGDLVIHHINKNNQDNTFENLVAIHAGCHSRLHHSGKLVSNETRTKISIAGKGRQNSLAHRMAIAQAGRERIWSAETRAKLSAHFMGRVVPIERRKRISTTLKARVAQLTPTEYQQFSLRGQQGAAIRWNTEQQHG